MLRVIFSGLRAHRARLARTGIAVVLGVAFVAGTYVFTDTLQRMFDGIVDQSTQGVDVYVRSSADFVNLGMSNDRQPVNETVVDRVRGIDGVAMADGYVQGMASLLDRNGNLIQTGGGPMLGMSWRPSRMSTVTLERGHVPRGPTEVALDSSTSSRFGFDVGDSIRIVTGGPVQTFRVVGIARFGRNQNLGGATMALFDLRTAQELYHRTGEVDGIEAVASLGVTPAQLAARIRPVLPPGVEAVTSATVANEGRDVFGYYLGFFGTALLVFALIALFVGAFLIFNTFTIIVAQQTREYGLLRSLGASPRQVTASVIAEAGLVGVVASAVGVGVGLLVARGLQALLLAFGMNLPANGLVFKPRTAIVAMALGIVITMVAALLPARKAARIPPIAALRQVAAHSRSIRARGIIGGIVFAVGALLIGLGLFAGMGNGLAWVGGGALLVFAGYGIASATIARPLAGLLSRPLPRLFGAPGQLARENSVRNPRRSATTAAALMIGVGLITFVSVFSASIKASASRGLDDTLRADYVVTGASGFGGVTPFSPLVAGRLAPQPEFAEVSPLRVGEWRLGDSPRFLAAVDPETISAVVNLGMRTGSVDGLSDGGVLVRDVTAEQLGVGVGDTVAMRFARTGTQRVPVVGTFHNGDAPPALQSDYLISIRSFEQWFSTDQQQDSSVFVVGARGYTPAQVQAELDGVVREFPTARVMDQAQLKAEQARQIDQLMGLMTALLALAVVIGLVGIANTLSLSILERTRELGLLRAVGMTRRQTRSMIRCEAAVIAVLGAVLGIAIGVAFGWAVVTAMRDSGITVFAVPIVRLLLFAAVAGLAGVVAAMPPARRAAKLDVLKAVATE